MFNYIRFDKVFGADKITTNNKPLIANFPIYRNTFFWFDTSYPQFLISYPQGFPQTYPQVWTP